MSGAFVCLDIVDERSEEAAFAGALRLTGTVASDYDGGGAPVPIDYLNPVTEQRLTVDTPVWRVPSPDAGEAVAIEVDRDDPGHVRLAGDGFTAAENLAVSVIWPLAPIIALALRRWGHVRARRVLQRPTSFVMLGALTPAWRLGRYCHLQLFALDSKPGDAAVCSVPVVVTHGVAVPSGVFEVDVHGLPRASGRVVARAGDVVFWPAARALTGSRARRPWHASPQPVAGPVVQPPSFRASFPWANLGPEAALVAAGAVLFLLVATTTVQAARDVRRDLDAGVRTVGEVVGVDDSGEHVVLRVRDPRTGSSRRVSVAVDWPEDHPVGRRYPVVLGRSGARLAREPYDATEPMLWAASPIVAGAFLLARRVLRVRANLHALHTGPFTEVVARPLPPGRLHDYVGIATGDESLRAVVAVTRRRLTASQQVIAAGDVMPGAPAALVVGGVAVIPAGPCTSPRGVRALAPIRVASQSAPS